MTWQSLAWPCIVVTGGSRSASRGPGEGAGCSSSTSRKCVEGPRLPPVRRSADLATATRAAIAPHRGGAGRSVPRTVIGIVRVTPVQSIAVNLRPLLRAGRAWRGLIVNLGSVVLAHGDPGHQSLRQGWHRGMSRAGQPADIRVNVVPTAERGRRRRGQDRGPVGKAFPSPVPGVLCAAWVDARPAERGAISECWCWPVGAVLGEGPVWSACKQSRPSSTSVASSRERRPAAPTRTNPRQRTDRRSQGRATAGRDRQFRCCIVEPRTGAAGSTASSIPSSLVAMDDNEGERRVGCSQASNTS